MAIKFLEEFPVHDGEKVLDVACGTGIVARHAAMHVGRNGKVKGIDLNAGMLEVAKSLAPSEGAEIEWYQGDATRLPFEDDEFDVVLCQQGLQFFSDKSAALREIFRVLGSGGRLGVCVGRSIEHGPYSLAKAEALGRHVSHEAEEQERNHTPFSLGKSEELHEFLVRAGFEDIKFKHLEITADMGPLEEAVNIESFPELEEEIAAKVVNDVYQTLEPYVSEGYLYAPFRFNLGLGHKK